tara:strand:+ start:3277 stop:4353 length:1077 start_codon:yes stop_codon:yes gene_type:complete
MNSKTDHIRLKELFRPLRESMADFSEGNVRRSIHALFTSDTTIRMCHPFGDLNGPDNFFENVYKPLILSIPDLERRDLIILAGTTPEGQDWIGTMGNYMGTFLSPYLDIPATGHLVHMRYHEFFRFQNDKVIEIQAIWDIPELMMLAKSWPMAPQLGAFLCTPAPMTGDGLGVSGSGEENINRVKNMLTDLCRHPADPNPEVMNLEKHWHRNFNWYGPTGIGTSRGVSGFRHWHQIPFLRGMPDRKLDATGDRLASMEISDLISHWIAEGSYVCETGWPNMRMNLSHDGWMGIAPSGKQIELRSLDFWRLQAGLIRENWVLVDLLDVYRQVGVDVFARLKEFNKARSVYPINNNKEIT